MELCLLLLVRLVERGRLELLAAVRALEVDLLLGLDGAVVGGDAVGAVEMIGAAMSPNNNI